MLSVTQKNRLILSSIVAIIAIALILVINRENDRSSDNEKQNDISENSDYSTSNIVFDNKLVVQSDDGAVIKIDIETGAIEDTSFLEQRDFSEFSGLPILEKNDVSIVEKGNVMVSNDKSQAIVVINITALPSNTLQESREYICNVMQKKCAASNLLSQSYQDLDSSLQKQEGAFWWLKWDSKNNNLYGIADNGAGQDSIVYICNTQDKKCNKTGKNIPFNSEDDHIVVPNGTFSPSLEKFVTINQYDRENAETGKTWALSLYASNDLARPIRTFDISAIIDRDENVVYDSVQSVAWSGDEKKIAIGTARRIFTFDFEANSFALAYVAPIDEDGYFYWDDSAVFLSADAKFIAFIDEADNIDYESNSEDDEIEISSINVLKRIDLQNANKLSELFRGPGLVFE